MYSSFDIDNSRIGNTFIIASIHANYSKDVFYKGSKLLIFFYFLFFHFIFCPTILRLLGNKT